MKTVLFEKGLLGRQIAISKEVENYPGVKGLLGVELAEKLIHHVQSFGLHIVQEEVAAVEPGKGLHAVRLANGDLYRSSALILALGASVRKLGIPGEAEYLGRGVSYCATCDGFFSETKPLLLSAGATPRSRSHCIYQGW